MRKQLFKRLFIGTHDLFWIEPYWNRWLELRTSLPRTFHLRACIRIAIATAIASIITIALFKLAIPNLNLGWGQILAGLRELSAIIPMLVVVVGLQAIFPSLICIFDNRITAIYGPRGTRILFCDTQTIRLSIFSNERVRLTIFYLRNKKRRLLKIAVSPCIDLEKLASLLQAEKLTIHDRRR